MAKRITTGFISDTVNGIKINKSYKCNSTNYTNSSERTIKYIVIHYTGNKKDTAKANANYFQRANCRASAHFFVDNVSIYQSVELRDVAWHCGGSTYYHSYCRNSNAIGIEMCCTAGNYKASSTTIENTAYLCANLCKRIGISANEVDKYVLRHYDITHKKCPAQFANSVNDADWLAFKKQVKKILGGTTTNKSDDDFKEYKVRIITNVLNIREEAGASYAKVGEVEKDEVFTIVDEKKNGSTTWGLLKSGKAERNRWISLKYTERV